MSNNTRLSIVSLLLGFISLLLPAAGHAQAQSAYDLVNAVNALRSAEGLAAYNVDPALMAYAQGHSDYMAAAHISTHLHEDGTLPQSIGLQENVAGGDQGVVTVAIVVNEIWVDWGHRHILTGYPYGDIGGGWALGDDGLIYCSVNVRPRKDVPTYAPPVGTAAPFVPYGTSTPNESGSIIHVVSAGQTLWSIAISYGTTMAEIRRLNALASDWTTVYIGQKLLIRKVDVTAPPPPTVTKPADGQSAAEAGTPAAGPPAQLLTPVAPLVFTATPAKTSNGGSPNYLIYGLAFLLALVMIVAFVFGLLDLSKRDRQ